MFSRIGGVLREAIAGDTSMHRGVNCCGSRPCCVLVGQFRGDRSTVRTLVFGVYKICCITGSYLWVIQKDITL